jgi:predicted XRE-type DNA-binding protein
LLKKNSKIRIRKGAGNVFADLGLPNAREKHTKVRLAVAINHILAARHLSQTRAARQLGINQPKISALSRYRLHGFSVERLMHFLARLGCDIEIIIRQRPSSRSKNPPASSSPRRRDSSAVPALCRSREGWAAPKKSKSKSKSSRRAWGG